MARSIAHPTVKITVRDEPGVLRLLIAGELDRENAWALTAAMIRSEPIRAARVIVDLCRLQFIDVGGIRAIVDIARRARGKGHSFAVANPSQDVARLFRLTGLDRSMEIIEPILPQRTATPDGARTIKV